MVTTANNANHNSNSNAATTANTTQELAGSNMVVLTTAPTGWCVIDGCGKPVDRTKPGAICCEAHEIAADEVWYDFDNVTSLDQFLFLIDLIPA